METPTSWDVINVGFEGADETINFGSRAVSDEQLYETQTIATISSETNTGKVPRIDTYLSNDKLYLSIDNTFRVLSKDFTDLEIMLVVANTIWKIAVYRGRYVALLMDGGEIQCLDIENEGDVVFSMVFDDEPVTVFAYDDGFVIGLKNGVVKRIVIDKICSSDVVAELNQVLFAGCASSNLLAFAGPENFSLLHLTSTEHTTTKSFKTTRKIYPARNGLILTVNEDGHFTIVVTETLLSFVVYEEITVDDFVFSGSQILALTKIETDSYLICLEYPSFEVVYRLKVGPKTFLVETDNEIIYVDGVGKDEIEQLRLKSVAATDPALKLNRLLQRGRIDEAEKFAEKWNLNAEPVWKARARIVADKTTCADFDHFATILNQIKDVKFIVHCCMDVNIPDVVNAKKLYGYCQRRLRASMASNPNDKRIWKLLGKVSELSKRLDLYSFLVTDSSVFSDEWERFSGCNLVEYSRKLVETGELQKSTMVLLRVEEEQIKEVFRSRENVLNYLEAAPNKTDINDIVVWFRSIFNCITNAVPDSLPFFISWLTMRLQRLENVPEKAITFAEGILEAIRLDGGETSLSVSPALDHVQNIVSCLHQINHLRSSHHITVSLSEFLEGGTALVSYLLTSVDVSDIRLLYSDFLLPYMRRHQLAPDETLSAYINEISETEGGLWESRAAQIIPCIPSTTTRLRTLISTLHYVELPWTATITALVDDVLRNTTHPLCDEIRQSRDDIPFRILLRKHFRRLNVPLSLSNFQVFQIASKVLRSPDDPTDDFEVLIRKFPKLSAKLKAQLVVSRHEDTQTEGLIRAMSQDELRTCFVMLNSGDDDGLDTDIMRLVYERIANVPAVFTKWMAEAERTREYRVPAKKLHDVVSESFDRSDWDATVKRICRTARQFGYRECDAAFELARQTSGNLTVIIAILENVSDEMTWEEDLQLVRLAIWSCCEDEDEMDGDVSQDLSNSMNTTLAKFATVDEQKRGEGTKKCLRTAEKFVHLAVEKGGVSEACEVARWLRMLTAMDDVVALAIARDAFAALPGTPDWIGASQLGEFIESLPLRLQGVQIDLSILQLLQTMSVTVRNTAWHSHIENFQNALVPLVLNKLLRTDSRYVVLFILKHMTHGQALSWFKHALTQNRMDLQSLAAGARLALSYVQSIPRSPAAEVGYRDIVLRCKWWERCFATMNVSLTYSEHFQVPPERLVEILVESDVGTLSTITELCDDYKINHKKFLPKYLRNFLIRWRPNGSDTVDDLVKQCRNVIAQIDDETVTTKLLQTICDQISYYRYETFMCIMKLLSDKQEVNALLLFLREYKRISKPSQGEVEEWMKWFPNTPELDPLASTRLPYLPVETLLQDDWRILRPEVTLDTYPTWFNAMHIIGLNKNDICTYAIKNAILTGVLGRVGDGTWLLERQHPDIVEKIAECASSMSNYEMATAVLFQAMLHTAGGADQCDLARHCWETCRKWMATGNAPEESVERVWNKYLSCHTEHILQENNLVNEKYLKLLSQPQQLVLLLYQDERIVRRNAFDRISINEAVDKIGSVHEIDVTKLREDIIEQTLQTESTDCAHRRICYICESPRDEPWTAFLSNYHNAPNALPIRVLALRCMSTLLGPNFTSTQHLETLQFLHRLQGVGVSFSENEFAATSKPDLVRKLSKLQSPNAIHLAVDLSNDYSLQDPILWENILRSRSLDLLPAKTLRDILARLGRLKHVATGSTYLIVWARLITRIVSSSVANDTNWAFAFSLLLYCPDMSRVDLRKLAENCVQRERPEVAVCLAMYMEEDARKETFNEVVTAVPNPERLRERLKKLAQLGVPTTNTVFQHYVTSVTNEQ